MTQINYSKGRKNYVRAHLSLLGTIILIISFIGIIVLPQAASVPELTGLVLITCIILSWLSAIFFVHKTVQSFSNKNALLWSLGLIIATFFPPFPLIAFGIFSGTYNEKTKKQSPHSSRPVV